MQPDQLSQVVGGQGTPSPLSPTPSPAGSVGSVGSQSSGYSSGELAVRGGSSGTSIPQQPPVAAMGPCMPVPLPVHHAIQKQNAHFGYISSCYDLWEQADQLVTKGRHTGKYIYILEFYYYKLFEKTIYS